MRPIDADALKEWVEEYHASNRGIPQDELIYAIGSAPTIEPKKGKWIQTGVSPQEIAQRLRTMKCSYCGEYQTAPYLGTFKVFNFCPNCGARMDGSEE